LPEVVAMIVAVHLNQLYADQDPPGVEEALETKHWSWRPYSNRGT